MILFEIFKWKDNFFYEKTVFINKATLDLFQPAKQNNFTLYRNNNPQTVITRPLYFKQR